MVRLDGRLRRKCGARGVVVHTVYSIAERRDVGKPCLALRTRLCRLCGDADVCGSS